MTTTVNLITSCDRPIFYFLIQFTNRKPFYEAKFKKGKENKGNFIRNQGEGKKSYKTEGERNWKSDQQNYTMM